MSAFAIYEISTGQYTQYCIASNIEEIIHICSPTENIQEVDIGFQIDNFYYENGLSVPIPAKPNQYDVFDYVTKQWVDPRTPETQWPIVRQQRDLLLQQSDYTQLPDVPLDNKPAWATYRQELRDVTNQPDPFNIVWPIPPA